MSPSGSLDAIRKRYLDDFSARGIDLDSQQLERLNNYIIKEYQSSPQSPIRQEPLTPSPTTPRQGERPQPDYISSMAQRATAQPDKDFQSLDHLNKLGVGLWYGLESYLWEAPGFLLNKMGMEQPYNWEELTPGEKAVAVGAGGGALFLPGFGGFRGLTKLGGFVTSRVAQKGTVKLGRETAGKVITGAVSKSKKLQNKGLNQSLRKGWDDVLGKSQNELIGIQASKKARHDTVMQLEKNLHAAAYKTLKEAGVKGSDAKLLQTASEMTGEAMRQLIKNKKSVNSISEWIHLVVGKGASSGIKANASKWFGMAVQDAYMLGTHSMVSSYLAASKHNQEWQPGKAFGSAMALSVAFPAIRAIRGGGEMSLGKGVKHLWDKWKVIDYNSMATSSGTGAVKHSLRMLLNRTDLSNKTFQALDGKTGRQILNKIDDMSLKEVINSLNVIRKQVSSEGFKKWIGRYPGDLFHPGSLARMTLGMGLMNFETFRDGHFEYMDTEELLAHMVVGAVMSRGRGEWSRENMRADQIDFARYNALMKQMGIKGKNLENLFNTWKLTEDADVVLSSKEAKPIMDVFTAYKESQKDSQTGDFNLEKHKIVADLAALYNSHLYSKSGGGEGYDPFIVERYSKKDLNSIKRHLEEVGFPDGFGNNVSVKDLGFEGTKNKLSIEFAKRVHKIYGDLFKELGEKGGTDAPVSYEVGKDGTVRMMHGRITFPTDGEHAKMKGLIALQALTEKLKEAGVSVENTSLDIHTLNESQMENVNLKKINSIMSKWEKKLPQKVYGKNVGIEGTIENNRFLEALHSGRQVEAIDRVYNIMVDRTSNDIEAQNFLKVFGNRFRDGRNRLPEDWEVQVQLKKDPSRKQTKKDAKDIAVEEAIRQEQFDEMKNDLSQINTLRRASEGNKTHNKKISITLDELSEVHKHWKSISERFPNDLKLSGVERIGLEYFIHRFTENKKIPADLYGLYEAAVDPSIGYMHIAYKTGEIFAPNDKVVRDILVNEKISPDSEYWKQTMDRHREMKDRLRPIGVQFTNLVISGNQIARMPTSADINMLWESQQKGAAQNLSKDAMRAVDKLNEKPGFELQVDKIKDIFDNSIDGEMNLDNRVSSLHDIVEVLDGISKGNFGEHEHIKKNIDTIRRKITRYINQHSQKTVMVDGQRLSIPEWIKDTDTHNFFVQNVKDMLNSSLKEEIVYRDRMRSTLIDIFSGSVTGDVTKELAYKQQVELKRVLLKSINDNTKEMTLEDAVEQYDKMDSWKNLLNVTQTAMEVINRTKNFNNPLNFFKSNAKALSDLIEARVRRSDIRTPIQIAKEWGLTQKGEPNKVSTDIIDRISKSSNPGQELANIVKENLAKDSSLTETGRRTKLQEFARGDGLTMLHYFVNSTRVKKAEWNNGYLVYDTNESTFSNGTIDFLKQFDFFLLDESGTNVLKGGKKSRRFQWGMEIESDVDGTLTQKDLNTIADRGRLVPKILEDKIYQDERYHSKLSDEGLPDSLQKDGFNGRPIFMRIGSQAILFIEDAKGVNVAKLNDKFSDWYKRHQKDLGSGDKKAFEAMWGEVLDAADSEQNLAVKMSVVYIDEVLNKRFMQEYLHENMWHNESARAKFESKLYQRSLIAGAGNGQRIKKDVLKYMNKRSKVFSDLKNDPTHQDIIKHYLSTDVKAGVLSDEEVKGAWKTDSPFHIRSITNRMLESKINNRNLSRQERENAEMWKEELDKDAARPGPDKKYPSLDASSIDGVEYVSERFAKLLWTLKGKEWGKFNGVKPYIFENNVDNTLIAKGYFVYDPSVSAVMGDMDILMGESSAKIYGGKSWSGRQMKARRLAGSSNDWVGNLRNRALTDSETMRLNIENISLGVANGDKNAASRSHTITDYQNHDFIKRARVWQELRDILDQTIEIEKSSQQGNHLLVEIIRQTKESEGYEYTDGAAGLAMDIIMAGGKSNNPIIRKSVSKLIQGPMLDIIRTANSKHSVDAMIAPDVLSELSMPIFAKVRDANPLNPTNGTVTNRVQLELGGTKIPHALGQKKIRKFHFSTFVWNSNGVDVLVSPNLKNLKTGNVHRSGLEDLKPTDELLGAGVDANGQQNVLSTRRILSGKRKVVDTVIRKLAELYGTSTEISVKQLYNAIESLKRDGYARYGNDFARISDGDKAILNEIRLQLAVSGHPIPRVGLDMSPLRVEGIGSRAEGNISKINHYDLRTGFQRDHDGDRFYLHHDMGVGMMDILRGRYSSVEDYPQLPKNPADINIFGIDGSGKAGTMPNQVGFNRYHATIQQQKMNVGRAISMKSVLTTMSNTGFTLNGTKMNNIGNLNYSEGNTSRAKQWQSLVKMMNLNQSMVDVHTGLNGIAEGYNEAGIDAILFGTIDETKIDAGLAKKYGIHPDNSLFGSKNTFNRAEKAVVKEIINHIKKSSRIFNDVYDEGGQRAPLEFELRDAYNSLNLVYGDTKALNREVFDSAFKKAVRTYDWELANQLLETFFKVGNRNAIPELREFLTKGKKIRNQMHTAVAMMFRDGKNKFNTKQINDVVSFGSHSEITNKRERVKERIRESNAGYILDEMMSKNAFVQEGSNWGNIDLNRRRDIGLAASDIVRSYNMMKTLYDIAGEEIPAPSSLTGDDLLGTMAYKSFPRVGGGWRITDAQKRGALKVALEGEKRAVERALRFEKSDKYRIDIDKIESFERRIDDVNTVIKYIEELGFKDLVKNSKNYKAYPINKDNKRQKANKNIHLYRMKRPGQQPTGSMKDGKVKFNELEFIRSVRGGDYFERERGYFYVELYDGVSPTNMDENTLRHSYSLLKRTIYAEPSDFFKSRTQEMEFVNRVRRLRGLINANNNESSMVFRENKSISKLKSTVDKSEIHKEITSLMKEFNIIDKDGEITDVDLYNMALRYTLIPSSVEGFMRVGTGKDALDIPTFRMNNRVIQEMLDWSFNSGHEVSRQVASDFIKDWTATAEGREHVSELGIEMMQRSYGKDYYRSGINPELADLATHMAGYNDVLVRQMFDHNGLVRHGKESVIDLIEQSDVYIKRLYTEKMEGNWCR